MKKIILMAAVAVLAMGCGQSEKQENCKTDKTEMTTQKQPFTKKYTNADFYKDGVFQQDVAKKAFLEMFDHYGYAMTPFLEENIWFADFGLGDFENCGMGGVFWVNDAENGYFAHDIYLLPGQMIPEHKHVKTDYPAKIESWMVLNGGVYSFSEVVGSTENAPKIAESQKATTISDKFVKQEKGQILHLIDAGAETFHFMMAGENGAIVNEWANYHDGAGLRFSNPKAIM